MPAARTRRVGEDVEVMKKAFVYRFLVQSNGTTWSRNEAARALAVLDPGSERRMQKTQIGIDENLTAEFVVPRAGHENTMRHEHGVIHGCALLVWRRGNER
jgi:hypothetical protein